MEKIIYKNEDVSEFFRQKENDIIELYAKRHHKFPPEVRRIYNISKLKNVMDDLDNELWLESEYYILDNYEKLMETPSISIQDLNKVVARPDIGSVRYSIDVDNFIPQSGEKFRGITYKSIKTNPQMYSEQKNFFHSINFETNTDMARQIIQEFDKLLEEKFAGINSADELKKRYRDLMKIYHPDNQAGDTNAVQQIQQEYEQLLEGKFKNT